MLVCEGVRERERERQTDTERERERECVCVCVCARARASYRLAAQSIWHAMPCCCRFTARFFLFFPRIFGVFFPRIFLSFSWLLQIYSTCCKKMHFFFSCISYLLLPNLWHAIPTAGPPVCGKGGEEGERGSCVRMYVGTCVHRSVGVRTHENT